MDLLVFQVDKRVKVAYFRDLAKLEFRYTY